jgi:hypothetical protein
LHFLARKEIRKKMQPGSSVSGHTGCKGKNHEQQDQEDCMPNLVMTMFESGLGDISGFGLWMFLSIGAVALFVVFIPVTTWIESQRKEREAFYKAETMRRVVESSGDGAKMALEMLKEQDRQRRLKLREGLKIGGLTTMAVGVALLIFLHQLIPNQAVYLCGLIPGLIGVAQITYALLLAPKVEQGKE